MVGGGGGSGEAGGYGVMVWGEGGGWVEGRGIWGGVG